jgi:hypothetical protein
MATSINPSPMPWVGTGSETTQSGRIGFGKGLPCSYLFVPLGPAQGCLDILIAQDDALAAFPREKGPPPIHKGRALFLGAAEQAQMHAQPR